MTFTVHLLAAIRTAEEWSVGNVLGAVLLLALVLAAAAVRVTRRR